MAILKISLFTFFMSVSVISVQAEVLQKVDSNKSQQERAEILTKLALCMPQFGYSMIDRLNALEEAHTIYSEINSPSQADALESLIKKGREDLPSLGAFWNRGTTCPQFRSGYLTQDIGRTRFEMYGVNIFVGYSDENSSFASADAFCQYGGFKEAVGFAAQGSLESEPPTKALLFTNNPVTGRVGLFSTLMELGRQPTFLIRVDCR